jgi:hypothetical protein
MSMRPNSSWASPANAWVWPTRSSRSRIYIQRRQSSAGACARIAPLTRNPLDDVLLSCVSARRRAHGRR